ncbi:MAG TPA: SsrA-binding protein [Candidatus Magasanikbacteria bacterium]|nr:SsrA-binding protein [Candidatus Magasanikbacteria bacterium]
MTKKPAGKTLALNKHAKHDYEILETFEAGLVLTGQEVKSAKAGQISLKGSYVTINQNEAWLLNAHISAYKPAGGIPSYDPTHSRKLLLKRKEIERLRGKIQETGLTAVPLAVYTSKSRIKVEVGLGRGKKQYEKKETLKKRDVIKEIRRTLKNQ